MHSDRSEQVTIRNGCLENIILRNLLRSRRFSSASRSSRQVRVILPLSFDNYAGSGRRISSSQYSFQRAEKAAFRAALKKRRCIIPDSQGGDLRGQIFCHRYVVAGWSTGRPFITGHYDDHSHRRTRERPTYYELPRVHHRGDKQEQPTKPIERDAGGAPVQFLATSLPLLRFSKVTRSSMSKPRSAARSAARFSMGADSSCSTIWRRIVQRSFIILSEGEAMPPKPNQ